MVALERRPRPLPPVPKKLDGEKEARLVQVACSVPPEVREQLPVRPGSPEKYDAHYLRRGECTVWMFDEPLSGWRTVAVVTKRRTTLDWAKQVRALANLPRYRDAEPSRWCATT